MMRRLWKEYRALWPYVAAYVGASVIVWRATWPALDGSRPGSLLIGSLQALAGLLLGAAAFGSEFSFGTMERLLSEPFPRARIWREKLLALAIVYVAVMALAVVVARLEASLILHASNATQELARAQKWPFDPVSYVSERLWIVQGLVVLSAFTALAGLSVGPLATLLLRQAHTGFWAALVLCGLWYLFMEIVNAMLLTPLLGFSPLDVFPKELDVYRPLLIVATGFLVAYPLARRVFLHLEV